MHFQLLTYYLQTFSLYLDEITEAITLGRQNILHPILITPFQLLDNLIPTLQLLPKNLQYPVSLEDANAHILFKLSDVKIELYKNQLLAGIKIPLILNNQLTLYNILPLPGAVNGTFVFIQPSIEWLAISESRQDYIRHHIYPEMQTPVTREPIVPYFKPHVSNILTPHM